MYGVAVALEKGIHVIEITISAIYEICMIAVLMQCITESGHIFVAFPAKDGLSWRRWQGEGDRL